MAVFKIEAGAEIDIATGDELDNMGESIVDRLSGRKEEPRYFSRINQGQSATSATVPFQLGLGSPTVGHKWDILGLTTAGLDDATVIAGGVSLYIGDRANMSLLSLKVPATVIPSYRGIGRYRIWANQSEEVFVNVAGVPNSTIVTAIIQIAEWRVEDVSATGLR